MQQSFQDIASRAALLTAALGALAALAAGPAAARAAGSPVGGGASPADSITVEGVVTDAATGDPLAGTQVRILELGRRELAHGDGAFHFDRIPAGRYTLVFEHVGYRRVTREIVLGPAKTVRVDVALEFSAIELPGLVVTGALGARLGEQALRATNVVSGQELERKLGATIAATLRNEPGLATVSTGPATARPVIRGLGGDRILLLEDGERVGDLSAGSADHAVAIEAVTARQIEVVRGPAALLYGSNALGGVVNVIREEVPASLPDRVTGSVTLQGQSVNRGITAAGYATGAVGPIALRAEGSGRWADDLATPVGDLENTGVETYNLSAGAGWIGTGGRAGGAYRYYESEYGIPGFEGGHAEGVTIRMRRHTARGQLRIESGLGPFESIEVDGGYSNYYHAEIEHGGILGTEFGLLTATGDVLARHAELGPFAAGAIGFQAQWHDYAAGGSLHITPSNEYALAAFFLEELDFDPLRIQLGGRYDWRRVRPAETGFVEEVGEVRTREFGSVSASLGALYDLGAGFGLGASVARAFRTPGANELFSEGPHLAVYSVEVGNPDLEEEIGLGLDVFLRVTRDRFKAELAAFRNAIDDFIYARNTGRVSPTLLPIYQHDNADAVLSGVEGSAQWSATDRVVLDGTFSYVRGTITATDEPLPLIPPLNGRVGVRYQTQSFFVGAGWKGAASQDRIGEFETPTDGYHVFDASAGYRWVESGRIHSLTLRAENVTDTEYRDHLSRVKEIMPQAGRGFSLLYRLSF